MQFTFYKCKEEGIMGTLICFPYVECCSFPLFVFIFMFLLSFFSSFLSIYVYPCSASSFVQYIGHGSASCPSILFFLFPSSLPYPRTLFKIHCDQSRGLGPAWHSLHACVEYPQTANFSSAHQGEAGDGQADKHVCT